MAHYYVGVDADLCQGHAMCALEAPEVFSVPRRGTVDIANPRPREEYREQVERAIDMCPTQALFLNEKDG